MRKASKVFTVLVFCFLYLPMLVLAAASFNRGNDPVVFKGFTLNNYAALFQDGVLLPLLLNSVIVALISSLLATVLGTAATLGIQRMKPGLRRMTMALTNIPLTNPEIVTGVSLALLFAFVGQAMKLKSVMGFTTLLIAHVTFNLPYVILSVQPKLLQMDENGIWRMDFEDMDRRLRENGIRLAIFCSPHNPTGRVWERWEIERAMEIFAANDCLVISDEIWSDLIMPGYRHIPTQSVSEDARQRTLAFYAPSKTFSLAGLIGSYHIVYNARLRDRLRRQSALSHYNNPNILSTYALIGAYNEGEAWADELCAVVDGNHARACAFFRDECPGVKLMRPQGSYMLFLDCGDWCDAHGVDFAALLRRGVEAGVIWQNGEDFFWPRSIRLNLALPRHKLDEALERLKNEAFI